MRSIEIRYYKIKNHNPGWSTYQCLAHAVRGKQYKTRQIRKWFIVLVDKEDYADPEIPGLLKHLRSLTKLVEDDTLEGSNCPTIEDFSSPLTYSHLASDQSIWSKKPTLEFTLGL